MGKQVHMTDSDWLNYFIDRSGQLANLIVKKKRELDRCRRRIADLEAIIDENSHLDSPQPMNKEQGELTYLYKHAYHLENVKLKNLYKQKRSCDNKIRDLQGQIEENAMSQD